MRLEKLNSFHFDIIELQERQLLFNDLIKQNDYRLQLMQHDGYALMDGLECILMAGVIDVCFGRGISWCLLSKYAKYNMIACTRVVKNYLDNADFKRIETTVECGFPEGERWAEILGMKKECKMDNYCDGQPYYLYARCK